MVDIFHEPLKHYDVAINSDVQILISASQVPRKVLHMLEDHMFVNIEISYLLSNIVDDFKFDNTSITFALYGYLRLFDGDLLKQK